MGRRRVLGYSRAGAGALVFSKEASDVLWGMARCLWSLGALPDAAMLAKLLSAGMLKAVWVPDEATSSLRRRVGRRAGRLGHSGREPAHLTLARPDDSDTC